jgi:hypothetical protein
MSLGLFVLALYSVFFAVMAAVLEVKLDWTNDKELLLWYTITDNLTGKKERKFVKILKL